MLTDVYPRRNYAQQHQQRIERQGGSPTPPHTAATTRSSSPKTLPHETATEDAPSAATTAASADVTAAPLLPGSSTTAAAAAGAGVRPDQPWLDTMLSRLGRLPEDALLEVIHRLVEVSFRGQHSWQGAGWILCQQRGRGYCLLRSVEE
jgi:hypothetical protein